MNKEYFPRHDTIVGKQTAQVLPSLVLSTWSSNRKACSGWCLLLLSSVPSRLELSVWKGECVCVGEWGESEGLAACGG